MRINTAKQTLLRREPAFGYWLGLGSPLAAEALSNCGIDFILLDTQHGSWGPDSTIVATAAMAAGSAVPMARVATNNYTLIGRLLDEGMLGIVVPMVNTTDDAKAAAAACRFPPTGARSWGWGRARAYGDDYVEWIDEQVFLAVQIETVQAVENAEAIMSVPGVDGCWVGPGDLALSMGFSPREAAQREEHARALERVVQACRNTGKIPGFAGASPEDALRRAEQGFRFVTASGDMQFLMGGASACLKMLGLPR
ncbi:MAG: aldolase/citrate lyase family protein [Chloroflexi bacterium]|nr:aldolase/citrate lyase family protein [Chloroflexota bacterium]MDA8219301.1 aldolase/citrate lyase family protein [Dehalococcoidales bacterium]